MRKYSQKSFLAYAFLSIGYLLFLNTKLLAQNEQVIDSLRNVLSSEPTIDVQKKVLWDLTFEENSPSRVKLYANQLVKISLETQDSVFYFRGLYALGIYEKLNGNFDDANSIFFDCLKLAEAIHSQKAIGDSYAAIAEIYGISQDYQNSISYFNKAIEILRQGQNPLSLASALMNSGYQYYLSGQYDSALVYYQESGDIFKDHEFIFGQAYYLGNSGLVFAKQKNYLKAEKSITDAIDILNEFDDQYPITEFQIEMADIYLKDQKFSIALRYAQNAYQMSIDNNLKERLRDASLKLSEIYKSTGDFQKAYDYQSQYLAYRDSINNEETIRKMADLRTEFEVDQKQAELDLVEQQKAADEQRNLLIGIGLVAVLILIGIIALIQFRSSRQRKAANLLLASQKQELEQLNQTKDRFFSIISHDLRGPINAFAGISRMIKMYLKKGRIEEINGIAVDIDESAGRLTSLLDNLLEWAVQQQGQFPYAPEKVNLRTVADDLISTFDSTASGKEINLHSKITDDIWLFADKNSTATVFRNLVGNALKFTPEGGEVYFDAKMKGKVVHISVNDTGVGIPKDKFDQLFSLSEKKSTWGTAGEKGLGLGLQLAYEFTEMNNGEITVGSEEGIGTTFTVKLPLFETNTSIKEPSVVTTDG